MDQDTTWYGGRPRPGDIVLDGDAAPPPRKGSQPPLFGPLLWLASPQVRILPITRIVHQGVGSARRAALVAILPDNRHPSSLFLFRTALSSNDYSGTTVC